MNQIVFFHQLTGQKISTIRIKVSGAEAELTGLIPAKDEHILVGDKEYVVTGVLRDYDRLIAKVDVKPISSYDVVMYTYHTV